MVIYRILKFQILREFIVQHLIKLFHIINLLPKTANTFIVIPWFLNDSKIPYIEKGAKLQKKTENNIRFSKVILQGIDKRNLQILHTINLFLIIRKKGLNSISCHRFKILESLQRRYERILNGLTLYNRVNIENDRASFLTSSFMLTRPYWDC